MLCLITIDYVCAQNQLDVKNYIGKKPKNRYILVPLLFFIFQLL